MVLKPEYVNEAGRVAEQLQSAVGRVTIMSQEAHAARELADSILREAKERQRAGVATGQQTMKVADRIAELYGQGGSQRKRFWSSISMTGMEKTVLSVLIIWQGTTFNRRWKESVGVDLNFFMVIQK